MACGARPVVDVGVHNAASIQFDLVTEVKEAVRYLLTNLVCESGTVFESKVSNPRYLDGSTDVSGRNPRRAEQKSGMGDFG